MSFSADDHRHMARALALAERGLYTTGTNPRVGCVIVRDGSIIGEGFHLRPGEPHAEVNALGDASKRGRKAEGATVYVTLEPCNHFGRTPPCVDALIAARVARVVVALTDPNPLARDGAARLRSAGIAVEIGLLETEARELNIGFVSRMTFGRPWVRMKIAASLDGRTALADGESRWITGAEARRDGHHFRARACAMLTGIGTVKEDDPELTVRDIESSEPIRQPLRVVVDSKFELPLDAKILYGGGVLVAGAIGDPARIAALKAAGAEVIILANPNAKVDLGALMKELARRGINELHVEAGTKLNGSLLSAGVVDELLIYLAPRLLGDTARAMFKLAPLEGLADAPSMEFRDVRRIGDDLRIVARLARSEQPR